MSFEFTVLSDDRFIEILEAWVDSPWPKTGSSELSVGGGV